MFSVALAVFILLFAWGAKLLDWHGDSWELQQAMFAGFFLGAICGFKASR